MSKKRKLHQIKIVVPHSSIRLQLITGFLVPIIFIIIIGVVSYQKSYEGLTQNYEKSALTAIDMTADGRMISVNNPVDSGLIDTAESSSYVKVDGRRYYYMSAESSVTGGKIVVMVPIEYITAGTKDIRDITIAMIVEACIAAMLIATEKVSEDLIVWQTEILRYRKKRNGKRWRVWKTFRGIISYHYKNEIPDHDRSGNEK